MSKNNSNPTVSIISPSLNLGRFLEQTITSIQKQTYKSYEHIVVDGASTDNTLSILKKYPQIRWISEKDSGYQDALLKGLKMAKGKYIMICMVSDGYVNKNWLKQCVEVLENDPEVSLVWGFPQWMTEDGVLTQMAFPHFKFMKPPQKWDWFTYWLATGETLPNGNFCIRKDVFEKCNPTLKQTKKGQELFDFNYNFNVKGYLAYNIPVIADFGREHEGQLSKDWAKKGIYANIMKQYSDRIAAYKNSLLNGQKHTFRDSNGQIINRKFSSKEINKLDEYKYKFIITSSVLIQRGPYKISKLLKGILGKSK